MIAYYNLQSSFRNTFSFISDNSGVEQNYFCVFRGKITESPRNFVV